MSAETHLNNHNLWTDLTTLCSLGGRFAGSESERQARNFLLRRLTAICKMPVKMHDVQYHGWSRESWELKLLTPHPLTLSSHPLVRSPATSPGGVEAEVVDLGRGTIEDFECNCDEIPGRFVLVRHEYMFSTSHIHRRVKYGWALERGAKGFLIASHLPGDIVVTGSSGGEEIPALGISHESATALTKASTEYPRIHVEIKTRSVPAAAQNIIAEIPGTIDEWVVLCAHYDGHDLAQSAIDNATGVAAALNIADSMQYHRERLRRGLRVIFFTIEEWGLLGSRAYVDGLSEEEKNRIALVINLDSLVGGSKLTALTSEFSELDIFVGTVSQNTNGEIAIHRPMMANSDHYNFARHGIPALRLVSGFDEPDSDLRYLLTSKDTIELVKKASLTRATEIAAQMVLSACTAKTPLR